MTIRVLTNDEQALLRKCVETRLAWGNAPFRLTQAEIEELGILLVLIIEEQLCVIEGGKA